MDPIEKPSAEEISKMAQGHKANLSNPNTSAASKAHSRAELEKLGGEDAFYAKDGDPVSKNPDRVAGGLKAAINTPAESDHYVSQEGKEEAKEKLEAMK
ncbi:hypothetical protein BDY21DRAFT_344543 [Lineolata rhizophorae]|uniref:Conidiation protein 6-domain-containing protein n=1 Tax=Lineolata rhizophorae TaxID=578093 RepID=A0A6A6P2J9_9PEZI|nr:hypothetical protein BDY21DRAFT_344543 [Lineolata rhizophorae]